MISNREMIVKKVKKNSTLPGKTRSHKGKCATIYRLLIKSHNWLRTDFRIKDPIIAIIAEPITAI